MADTFGAAEQYQTSFINLNVECFESTIISYLNFIIRGWEVNLPYRQIY